MANKKAVGGPDELPAELLKLLLDGDAGPSSFHDIIVDTWKGGRGTGRHRNRRTPP